jgi:hypothetical protein
MRRSQKLAALRGEVEIGPAGAYGRHDRGFRLAALDHLDDITIGELLLPSLYRARRRNGGRLWPLLPGCHCPHRKCQYQILELPAHRVSSCSFMAFGSWGMRQFFAARVLQLKCLASRGQRKRKLNGADPITLGK